MNLSDLELEKLKFPIGDFEPTSELEMNDLQQAIATIKAFPDLLEKEVKLLKDNELSWRYRPGGWKIYEVIHHCADSHMNAYIRFKKALTEPASPICGYQEAAWVDLADTQELPINNALALLKPLHQRWTHFLGKMSFWDFDNGYYHPENQRVVRLSEATMLYQWHCNHHLAHIKAAKKHNF